jgi:hypothetical protein
VVPNVARVVDELVLHLHLRVLQPQRVVPIINLESSYPNGARAIEVLLRLLPLRVLDPNVDVPSHATDEVLELLALAEAVVGELARVGDFLLRRANLNLLAFRCLSEDLLSGDLDRRRSLILDPRGSGKLDLLPPVSASAKGVKREREGCAGLSCAIGLLPPVSTSAKGVKREREGLCSSVR